MKADLSKDIPATIVEEKSQMILAIRAPPGSKIELPKNDHSMPSANEYHDLLSYLKKKYRIDIDARGAPNFNQQQ
jgi:hypothetical protein